MSVAVFGMILRSHRAAPINQYTVKLTLSAAALAAVLTVQPPSHHFSEKGDDLTAQAQKSAFDLYREISRDENGNIFFSPFSIRTALAMTYAGAHGSTAEGMARALSFSENIQDFHLRYGARTQGLLDTAAQCITLSTANRLWAERNYDFLPDFLSLSERAYLAQVAQMDFMKNPEAARAEINQWTEDQTDNRIKDLLPYGSVDKSTRLVLTNAVYFKADWLNAFDPEATKERDFTLLTGKTEKHPFMRRRDKFRYLKSENLELLAIPYAGRKHSMVIALPHSVATLADAEAELHPELLNRLLRGGSRDVVAVVPKFKLTEALGLKEVLKRMGMEEAFMTGADFSKMSEDNDLAISEVIHKAFIEIDEEGTEAAAATAVVMMQTSSAQVRPSVPIFFTADRPFLFCITDDATGEILFMGRLVRP